MMLIGGIFVLMLSASFHTPIDAKEKLLAYAKNVYSQFGEDGILEKIFDIIGPKSKICIEFGASDGLECSNTALLWKTKGWHAVLIEADKQRFHKCLRNTEGFGCICINAHVGYTATDSLKSILQSHAIESKNIDLLSIDIDGNDYYILQTIQTIHPRVVVCEFNPSMPITADIYSEPDSNIGCSAGALIRLARSIGYQLVSITVCNCIFVCNEEFEKFDDFETAPEALADDSYVKYYISSFDGKYCIVGKETIWPWGHKGIQFGQKLYGAYTIVG